MKKVLLVEDDRDDQFLMNEAFNAYDKKDFLLTADDGLEAIKLLEYLPVDKLPAFIIADIHMPLMGGKDLLLFLKAQHRYKTIPVILYSTAVHAHEKENCLQSGAVDYIKKPHLFADYVAIAESIINRLSEINSL